MDALDTQVLSLAREMLALTLLIAGPLLLVGLVVGVAVSVFQALTSVQEQRAATACSCSRARTTSITMRCACMVASVPKRFIMQRWVKSIALHQRHPTLCALRALDASLLTTRRWKIVADR